MDEQQHGPQVRHDAQAQRYDLFLDGVRVGSADAMERDGVAVMPHTVVDPDHGGQGLGGVLVAGALDDLRARGMLVDPQCSFVRDFVVRHPQYADLLVG